MLVETLHNMKKSEPSERIQDKPVPEGFLTKK